MMLLFKGRSRLPGLPTQEEIHAELEPYLSQVNEPARSWQLQVLNGWTGIIRDLHRDLLALNPDYQIGQVKEKFGTLRFYADGVGERGEALIRQAEELSARTCEHCGRRGRIRRKPGQVFTLCTLDLLAERLHDLWWSVTYRFHRRRGKLPKSLRP